MDIVKIFEFIDDKDLRAFAYVDTVTDINYQDENGDTMLHRAAINKNYYMLDYLIYKKADVNLQNKSLFTPLIISVYMGDNQAVEKLLKAGADTEIAVSNGCTPLVIAVDKNYQKIVYLLIDYKANTNIINSKTGDPLILNCKDKVLRQRFINAGANVLACDREGICAVHQIIDETDVEALESLRKKDFDFNVLLPDRYISHYQTPLMYAAFTEDTRCVKKLLEYKCDIHYQHPASVNCFIGYLAEYQQYTTFNELISKVSKTDFLKLKTQLEIYSQNKKNIDNTYNNTLHYLSIMNSMQLHDKLNDNLKDNHFFDKKSKI